MRREVIALAAALTLAPCAVSAAPEAPSVSASVVPPSATVGDRIAVVLTLRVPAALHAGTPRFPALGGHWGDAEVAALAPPVRSEANGEVVYRQSLTVVAFRTGSVPLPPANILLPTAAGTLTVATPRDLVLSIHSVLPPNLKDSKPKPPAPLRMLPVGARFWWTLAALLGLIALGGWALWRRQRTVGDGARRRVAPPLEELLAALDQLSRLTPGAPSSLALHTDLSHALRRYLGRSLALPATESTTTELQRLLVLRSVPAAQNRRLIEILRACDLVKFARQEVGGHLGTERIGLVRQLAQELEVQLHPPVAEPDAAPLKAAQ